MQNSVILQITYDEEFGLHGFVVGEPKEGMNAATSGILIAHDILEHINGPEHIGSIGDELEALGALWYVRGQFDRLSRDPSRYSAHESIASDIVRMFRDAFYSQELDLSIPEFTPCDFEDDFKEILQYAACAYESEIDSEDFLPHEVSNYFEKYKAFCIARLHIGYNKACTKYGPSESDAWNMQELFRLIESEVDSLCKEYVSAAYLGIQIELRYGLREDTNAPFVMWTEVYPEGETDNED